MTKKDLKITIEEDVLEKAKKHISNLSNFVEECLKYHLGLADGTYPIVKDLDILDKISKLQVELFLINQNFDLEESRREVENFEKDKAWRFLWLDYRKRFIPDKHLMETAVSQLETDEETLEDILDFMLEFKDRVNAESWKDVLEGYNKNYEEWIS